MLDEKVEITFVFLGEKLPSYAGSAIRLASLYGGLPLRVIGSSPLEKAVIAAGAAFTSVEDFYDAERFREAAGNISSSPFFRNGFWVKTLERFFVLEQYMENQGSEQIFHAELDQLLFGVGDLVSLLQQTGDRGLFVPFHDDNTAVASIMFCNSYASLESLTRFAAGTRSFANEMELIAAWGTQFPHHAKSIPTLADIRPDDKSGLGDSTSTLNRLPLWATDALQVGLWVGGENPRNLPFSKIPSTKYFLSGSSPALSYEELCALQFNFDNVHGRLFVSSGALMEVRLFNLHVHSKIHRYLLRSDSSLTKFFTQANQEIPIVFPGTRKSQVLGRGSDVCHSLQKSRMGAFELLFARIGNIFHSVFNLRPSSSPFLSGDSFRASADHVWESKNRKLTPEIIKSGDVVFCETDQFESLRDQVLAKTEKQITLLLANSDRALTELEIDSLDCLGNVSVFSQNCLQPSKKAAPLPIGLENAWRHKNGRVRFFSQKKLGEERKVSRVMWTFAVETNPKIRNQAADALRRLPNADYLGEIVPSKHRKALRRYAFVACPPGNGVDTHRMWEAMYLRSVPIVLESPLTKFYSNLGLPVMLVRSYTDLLELSEFDLERIYATFVPKFSSKVLWLDYWLEKIRQRNLDHF